LGFMTSTNSSTRQANRKEEKGASAPFFLP